MLKIWDFLDISIYIYIAEHLPYPFFSRLFTLTEILSDAHMNTQSVEKKNTLPGPSR